MDNYKIWLNQPLNKYNARNKMYEQDAPHKK
jgi:hypothetical protein